MRIVSYSLDLLKEWARETNCSREIVRRESPSINSSRLCKPLSIKEILMIENQRLINNIKHQDYEAE